MNEIKVGEYVRTKYGITQYREYETNNGTKLLCMPVKDGSQGIFANIEDVIKSSPNIIDLIEVGDYVNGKRVIETENRINDDGEKVIITENYDEWTDDGVLANKQIKSICTREQFENIEYKVEE